MKIVVTGATGFIGRHVVPLLLADGHEVVAIARRPEGFEMMPWKAQAQCVTQDIHSPQFDLVSLCGVPDALLHLAWLGLPKYREHFHFERSLSADYAFLKQAVEANVRQLVVTGTCLEYGMQSGPLNEYMSTSPTTPYGFAKDALRRQLEFLKMVNTFALTWARLFYLYGEGQAESSVLPQLRKAVMRGDTAFNMSGGEQLRDYIHVTEAARLLVALTMKRQDVGVVNVCSGKPVSVRRLVEGLVRENDWSIALNLGHYPYPDYEPMAFWGDTQKLNKLLATPVSKVKEGFPK